MSLQSYMMDINKLIKSFPSNYALPPSKAILYSKTAAFVPSIWTWKASSTFI